MAVGGVGCLGNIDQKSLYGDTIGVPQVVDQWSEDLSSQHLQYNLHF